jgi:hypothetical protein
MLFFDKAARNVLAVDDSLAFRKKSLILFVFLVLCICIYYKLVTAFFEPNLSRPTHLLYFYLCHLFISDLYIFETK